MSTLLMAPLEESEIASIANTHCIHHLFNREASLHPEAIALRFEETALTYEELNGLANQFALYLVSLGVKRGDLVGLSLPPCLNLGIALLGILKAGAAYCPLDPSYPLEYLENIVNEARFKLLVTARQSKLASRLAEKNAPTRIVASEDFTFSSAKSPLVEFHCQPDDLAYVIFTSGSTGKPKGVAVGHRSVVNLLLSLGETLEFSCHDVLFSVTPISFDIFGLEFFLPLLKGGICQLEKRNVCQSGLDLMQALDKSQATFMQATPATWRMLTSLNWRNAHLRHILCGGEAWDMTLAKKLLSCLSPQCRLWNVYGPTETTIWSLCNEIKITDSVVSLGKPIANTKIHILDDNLLPCEEGELYIEGIGLARGYWQNPPLTAKSFITHPFSKIQLYATGDLVKYGESNTLHYLSRKDDQVKIRGFRIELGEIETHLNDHPDVKQSVVVAVNSEEEGILHAFILAEENKSPSHSELIHFLSKSLPTHMIPSRWHFVSTIGMTENGKVNRKDLKLKAESSESLKSSAEKNEENSPEDTLRLIWSDILKVNEIPRDGHFFHLGGHSLLAVRLLSRIRRELNVNVGMNELMDHLIFSKQVALICAKFTPGDRASAKIVAQQPPSLYHPVSYEQLDYIKTEQESGEAKYSLYTPNAWEIKGELDLILLKKAIQHVVNKHESLRTIFEETKEGVLQKILKTWDVEIPFENLAPLQDADKQQRIDEIIEQDIRHPFDLFKGPLIRFKIIRLNLTEHILLTNNHHIIMDGWSKTLFFREIANFYRDPKEEIMPDSTPQYRHYVDWQDKWLQSGEYRAQLNFWQQELGDKLNPLRLDFGQTIPDKRTFFGGVKYFCFSQEIYNGIKKICLQEEVTLFQCLLAIFSIAMRRFSQEKKQLFSTVVAGRHDTDMEEIVGNLINTVLIKLDVSENRSLKQVLHDTKKQTLNALENQKIPFDKLLEEMHLGQIPYHNLPGLVMLIVHNTPKREFILGENRHTKKMPLKTSASILDLILDVRINEDQNLEGSIEYSTDLYKDTMMEIFINHYLDTAKQLIGSLCQ